MEAASKLNGLRDPDVVVAHPQVRAWPGLREGAQGCFWFLWKYCGYRRASGVQVGKPAIAGWLHCATRSVERYMVSLEKAGLIDVRGCDRGVYLVDVHDPFEAAESAHLKRVAASDQAVFDWYAENQPIEPPDVLPLTADLSADLSTDPRNNGGSVDRSAETTAVLSTDPRKPERATANRKTFAGRIGDPSHSETTGHDDAPRHNLRSPESCTDGIDRRETGRPQPTTSQGIVTAADRQARSSSVVAVTEAAAAGSESDPLAPPPEPPDSTSSHGPAEGEFLDSIGTGRASRAGAHAPITNQEQEQETFNANLPIYNHQSAPSTIPLARTASPPTDPEPSYDVDAYIDSAQQIEHSRYQRVRDRVVRAIRAAEKRLGITAADSGYMRGAWLPDEWARQVADPQIEIGEGHVTELVRDLETYAKSAPGGYAFSRLQRLFRKATGRDLRRRRPK